MSNDKIDYGIWANVESWSVSDAENIIVGYNKTILSDQGITDFSAIDSYLQKFDDNIIAFTDKRILVQVRGDDGYAELDGNGNEVFDLDCKRTKVNIKDFISWTFREGIPLPKEIIEIIRPVAKDQSPVPSCSIQIADSVTGDNEVQNVPNDTPDNISDSTSTSQIPNTNQYRFEKTAQSWNIKFGDIELIGVKDLVGMEYISILLKNPGAPIGVIQIQALLNTLCMNNSGDNQYGELEDQDEPPVVVNSKSNRSSKSLSLENLKNRLLALSKERNTLDPDCDHIELEAIDNEYAQIEAEIDNILYSKNDDPEIKKNRDKVAKAIKAAIDNISGLKTREGYASTPISNFLSQHIKTASECVYNPPTINPPEWSF